MSKNTVERTAFPREQGIMVIVNKNAYNPIEEALKRFRKKVSDSGKLEAYMINQHFRNKREKRNKRK